MDLVSGGFAAGFGTLAFFGGIALLMWVSYKGEAQKREYEHAERMKALELGQTLPDADIARANADGSRARAAGTIGTLVPLATVAAAIGATALVVLNSQEYFSSRVPMLGIIWGVSGLVSVVTVVCSVSVLHRRGSRSHPSEGTATGNLRPADSLSVGIKEPSTSL
jgi:hypothetical protein